MKGRKSARHSRRGYPVAVLVGLDDSHAIIWTVYSESIKRHNSMARSTNPDSRTEGTLYNFYNAIVASMKSVFAAGVGSLVVTGAGSGSSHADEFISHIRKHHAYLLKTIRMSTVAGDAGTVNAARALARTQAFQSVTSDVIDHESEDLGRMLDARLYDSTGRFTVLFSLEETDECLRSFSKAGEAAIERPEYVLMTDTFWSAQKANPRLQRIVDLARNTSVKTRVLRSESEAGARVAQLGGLVCFLVRITK